MRRSSGLSLLDTPQRETSVNFALTVPSHPVHAGPAFLHPPNQEAEDGQGRRSAATLFASFVPQPASPRDQIRSGAVAEVFAPARALAQVSAAVRKLTRVGISHHAKVDTASMDRGGRGQKSARRAGAPR
jgi:hypothetical protein